jgi:class 3 adenylate cyclase
VNLAARLQQAAAPGEILVGPLTRSLTERATALASGSGGSCAAGAMSFTESRTRRWYRAGLAVRT